MSKGAVLAALAGLIACGDPSVSTHGSEALGAPLERWELGSHAFPPIGVLDEPATHALDRPRLVQLDHESNLLVLNGRVEIRSFSREGAFLRSVGGQGDGPGEFRRIGQFRRLPQGRWVVLSNLREIVQLDSLGVESSRSRISERLEINVRTAMLGDGRLVALEPTDPTADVGTGGRARTVRDTVDVMLIDSNGEVQSMIGRVAGFPWRVLDGSWNGVPLGPRPAVGAHGGVAAFTDGTDYRVYVASSDAGWTTHLQLSDSPREATADDLRAWQVERNAYRESLGMRVSEPGPGWEPEVPDRLPAYSQLVVDEIGCVWAKREGAPGEDGNDWDVLDPAGRYLARLWTPETLTISEIRSDLVVGISEDDLGVGRIVGFTLEAPAPERSCSTPSGAPAGSRRGEATEPG